ncbi:hypothetical protein HDU86_002425 [Geranomyces michiganensis]|nr:hypothetical protein HDU86_002425 [Geranomyces michiganensis]
MDKQRKLELNSLHVDCFDASLPIYLQDLGVTLISLDCDPAGEHNVQAWAAQDGSHIVTHSRSAGAEVGGHPRTNHVVFKTRDISAFADLVTRRDAESGLGYATCQNPELPGIRWILVETDKTEQQHDFVEYEPTYGRFHSKTMVSQTQQFAASAIATFDHLACVVEEGQALPVGEWFMKTFGFVRHRCDEEEDTGQLVMLGDGALRMVTVRHADFYVVLAEPVPGYGGQVRDFVCAHGAGVQHIALKAVDIVKVAQNARATQRVQFAVPPTSAWEDAMTDAAGSPEFVDLVINRKEHKILTKVKTAIDFVTGISQPTGMLSQLFTSPLSIHTHLFLELIERKNYDGFAVANINSLFASQHVDMSILFVDETLGAEVLHEWAKTTPDFNIAITSLRCRNEEDLLRYLAHTAKYFSVIVSSFVPLTERVFNALIRAPALVSAQGIGYNHIDLDACRRRNIGVCNNAGWCSDEVAEHTMAAIVTLATSGCFSKTEGQWERNPRNKRTLRGTTFGLIGCGDIGRRVIPLARAFGMQVQVHDPPAGHDAVTLDDLLATSDYICLLAPLTPETYHMIDERALQLVKPGCCIINTARGGLIDEDALARVLQDPAGRVRAAALDVFESEPLPRSAELWALLAKNKILISPHVAGLTESAVTKAATQLIANFEALLRGQPLARVLVPGHGVCDTGAVAAAVVDTESRLPSPPGSEAGFKSE